MLYPTILSFLSTIVGILLMGSGLLGFFNPGRMARTFGLVNVSPDMTVSFPGIGGRNFAAGLIVCCLGLAGERKALGIFLSCWTTAGVADTIMLLRHYGEVDRVGIHIFNTCVLAIVGSALFYS